MNPFLASLCMFGSSRAARLLRRTLGFAVLAATIAMPSSPTLAQSASGTALADEPIFATPNVPGNLALLLSVEFPTAVSVAHTNRNYLPATQYLGHFDPDKCYKYKYTDGTSVENYFEPVSTATSHVCSGGSGKWSGNFLNWASMQTIDPFRWALTGGYRVIDEAARTVIEKGWATGQGGTGNFPDSTISGSAIAGATPFAATVGQVAMRIQGLGNKMRFTAAGNSPANFSADYFANKTLTGPAVYSTTNETSINYNISGNWPNPVVPTTNVSARWTGTITAPTAGAYQFRVRSDDGVRLTVNATTLPGGANVGWKDQGATNYDSAVFTVAAGDVFNVTVEWYQGIGGGEISLSWLRPGDAAFSVVGGTLGNLYATTATAYDGNSTTGATVFEAFMRTKVCDPNYLETNCTAYGSNYKPEGLLQKYANKIRYSAFGYLNDSNILRDGGVLRAQQKFVGPMKPVPGQPAIVNTAREWDASTGIFTTNPDSTDASNTAAIFGPINNSGVVNYLNKFGEITPGSYKTYDNVSELYYAAIRYFKALPDVPEWTAVGNASAATKATWADGFPVITGAADPILYACQRNFILGIGDVNTHADKNLPGRLATQINSEPALPATVSADTSVDAVQRTDQVGALEGLGAIGSNATYNTPAMAGLAFDSHIKDIRPDDASKPNTAGKQTIDTYWVDVQEYQAYANNNQFYLATKYGGFTVPAGYESNPVALTQAWWHTNTDTFGSNLRPDNYFSGGRPDLMKAGLDAAFAKISAAISAYTTSFSTALPQVALTDNSSFSAQYDPNTWTGEVTASSLSFDASTNQTTSTQMWKLTDKLAAQFAGNGWSDSRRVLTWNGTSGVAFRASGTTQLAAADLTTLDTSYVTGNDSSLYLNYLRGDQTNEVGSTASGSTKAYRTRAKLIGDIVGSKARVVGPPSFPFSDATNPGYSTFKTNRAARRTVVYVGANDGMMHAINGALVTSQPASTAPALEWDVNAGKEMFAYVPRALFQGPTAPNTNGLASLGNPSFTHRYMVNATPSVNDVDFARVPDNAGAKQTPAATTSDWRSVLIGGLGKGGKSYYALDVTDPESMAATSTTSTEDSVAQQKVLWEFGNSTTGMGGELGYTYGDPLVMKTQKYGWVVVFTSGYNNADGKGYFLFVNPKTGALLEKVSTNTGSTSADAGLTHANAFIVDATDGTADAIYAGDLLGNLWRLDVTGTGSYSASGKLKQLASLTDASNAHLPQPVTSKPAIEVHPGTKRRFVMVGTGRLLDASDIASTQGQTFYAIADGYNASFNATPFPPATTPAYPITRSLLQENTNALDNVSFAADTQVGWFEELGLDPGTPAQPAVPASGSTPAQPAVPAVPSTGIAWRVISDSTTLSGSVAFASTLPNGSVCSPSGKSRVYARDYASTQSTVKALVGGSLTPVLYVSVDGTVTDLRYLSVRGKAVLLSGSDKGELKPIDIAPLGNLQLRRLNWRELQVVD